MASCVQCGLDRFYHARSFATNALTFLTLRAYGLEISFEQVKAGKYSSNAPLTLDLDGAQDLDVLSEMANDALADAEKRRGAVTDKCKSLLTFGALLLTVVSLLLPKHLAFQYFWMRILAAVAIMLLVNAIVIVLVFFDINASMFVTLSQPDVSLDAVNLKKSLINRVVRCTDHADSRTNYLVDLYKATRFCFLTSLTIIIGLVMTNILSNGVMDQTQAITREIRSDKSLINLLTGPKGDSGIAGVQGVPGPAGSKGDKGEAGRDVSADEVVSRLLQDARFQQAVQKAAEGGAASAPPSDGTK